MNADLPVLCFPFMGDEFGGSHISAAKLIKQLDKTKYTPLIALHNTEGKLADLFRDYDIPIRKAPDVPLLSVSGLRYNDVVSYISTTLPRLRSFLADNRVDLVHTNDGSTHINWGLAAKFARKPLLWHHRADPDAVGANYFAPLIADHIVTVSSFSCPRKPIWSVNHKMSVVHSPFDGYSMIPDRSACRARIISELGCEPETRFLAYFGSLIDRKRPILFVEAVHAYSQLNPGSPVIGLIFGAALAGSDLEQTVRTRIEELGIANQVRLMGFRQPVEDWMGGVDILLVTAVREPFGRTLIEAMQLGTPIIATNDGGNPEAIEDGLTGFLVPPERPEVFAPLIQLLLEDRDLWNSVSKSAQTHALAEYSSNKHVSQISRIYDQIFEERRRPRRAA